jgi:hypothetical protein
MAGLGWGIAVFILLVIFVIAFFTFYVSTGVIALIAFLCIRKESKRIIDLLTLKSVTDTLDDNAGSKVSSDKESFSNPKPKYNSIPSPMKGFQNMIKDMFKKYPKYSEPSVQSNRYIPTKKNIKNNPLSSANTHRTAEVDALKSELSLTSSAPSIPLISGLENSDYDINIETEKDELKPLLSDDKNMNKSIVNIPYNTYTGINNIRHPYFREFFSNRRHPELFLNDNSIKEKYEKSTLNKLRYRY